MEGGGGMWGGKYQTKTFGKSDGGTNFGRHCEQKPITLSGER